MTRDEARALPVGATVRYVDDRTKGVRFARLVATNGYKIAQVEAGGSYGVPSRRFEKRYEEIEVVVRPEPGETKKRLARRGR